MTIKRIGNTRGREGLPIISQAVVRGDTAYLCGITADPVGDVAFQTRQVLHRIDRLLAQSGTDKSQLLTAQVWLSDMALFAQHNAAWNDWVDAEAPPVRTCLGAQMWAPGVLVEITVTAAIPS